MKPKAEVTCNYCGRPAMLVTGRSIYPHRPDLYKNKYGSVNRVTPTWVVTIMGNH